MARWWKERDEWLPGNDPEPTSDYNEEGPDAEDIGDIADDSSDEFDESEPPQRGPEE